MKFRPEDLPPHIRELNGPALNWRLPALPSGHHHKYKAKEDWRDGIRFDSKLEARCYDEHKLRRAAGEIKFFLMQVPFRLPGGVIYRADFFAVLTKGGIEVTDAKGYDTQSGKNKRKQVEDLYGVKIQLWSGK